MAITNNPLAYGKAVDLSSSINLIPNEWGLIQRLGLFTHKYGSQKTIMIPRKTEAQHLMEDYNWDERNPSIAGAQRDFLALPIPHYSLDVAITPNDIDGNIDFEAAIRGGLQLETIEQKRAEKMASVRRSHSLVLEMARMQVIKDGTVYSPRGTVNVNYYTEFGITRHVEPIDLSSTTVAPNSAVNKAVNYLQEQLQTGGVASNFIALCSPSFFNALTENPFIVERYLNLQNSAQQIPLLVGSLAANRSPLDARYRTFDFAGVFFIECPGNVAGIPYIEEDMAYMMPRFDSMESPFETWFAPANRFKTINQTAVESYFFETLSNKDDAIEIMTETNFLNVVKRPDLIITLHNTTA